MSHLPELSFRQRSEENQGLDGKGPNTSAAEETAPPCMPILLEKVGTSRSNSQEQELRVRKQPIDPSPPHDLCAASKGA